jgi:hypothetical protein
MIKVLTFKDFSKNTKKIHQHFSQEQTHQIFSNPNYLNLGIFNKSKLCGYMFLNISDQIDII